MKKFLLFILTLISFSSFGYDLYAQPTSRVLDYSNVLSSSNKTNLENSLNSIYSNESNTEIEILLIPKLQDNLDLVDLNTKLFNSWKLGDKSLNNGILITIVTDTNNIRISTGNGLEGALPDSYLGRIMDENQIKQKLINKDYYNALNILTESMNTQISKENFGDHKNSLNLSNGQILGIIIIISLILVVGAFIPCGDSVLTFYIIYYLFEILLLILSGGKVGGGGSSSGGGSSR